MKFYPWLYQTSSGTPRDLGSFLSMKSQGYGDNVAYYQRVFGTNGHQGVDHPCRIGTPIYSPFSPCKVRSVSFDEKRGKGVLLENSEGRFLLWHFSEVLVDIGQEISGRIVVGLSGDSGISTGPHVHAEWRPTDTFGNYLYPSNGLGGAVDFTQDIAWEPQPLNIKLMTEQEVTWEYNLAFFRDPTPQELAYWMGKPLAEFLKVAIKDRASYLAGKVQ